MNGHLFKGQISSRRKVMKRMKNRLDLEVSGEGGCWACHGKKAVISETATKPEHTKTAHVAEPSTL